MQASVVETRNNFSSIVSRIVDGTIGECVVSRHDKPVVKIVPVATDSNTSNRVGMFDGDRRFEFDQDVFIALDDEIAREFGAVAESIGLTSSAAINVFVRQFVAHKGFPFEVRITEQDWEPFKTDEEALEFCDATFQEVMADETW